MLVKKVVKILEVMDYHGLTVIDEPHYDVINDVKRYPHSTPEHIEARVINDELALSRISSVILSTYHLSGIVDEKAFLCGYKKWVDKALELI